MKRRVIWGALTLGTVLVSLVSACGDGASSPASDGEAGEGGEGSGEGGAGGQGGAAEGGAAGASGGAGEGAGEAIEVADYCAEAAGLYRDWLATCYGSRAYPQERRQTDVDFHTEQCLTAEVSVEAGRISFDGVRARGCLDALDPNDCQGFVFLEGMEDCSELFTPHVENGDDCYSAATRHFTISGAPSECAEGYCDTTDNVCPGTCVAFKDDGEGCVGSHECQPESYCYEDECTPRIAEGEACVFGDACAEGLFCNSQPATEMGSCVQPSEAGQACSEEEPCTGGYFCIEGECQSKVETGEACLNWLNCLSDERCIDRDGEGAGGLTCGPPAQVNGVCNEFVDCDEGLYCLITENPPGVCLERAEIGELCTGFGECIDGAWCNLELGECQVSGGEGDSCLMFDQPSYFLEACEPDLFCMSNGECRGVGSEGDPCSVNNDGTCEEGFFCSRETFTCQPYAGEGEFCNPFWFGACGEDLGCLCMGAECEDFAADARVHDTLHTCQPRRALGERCYGAYECEGGDCIGDPLSCEPLVRDCLP